MQISLLLTIIYSFLSLTITHARFIDQTVFSPQLQHQNQAQNQASWPPVKDGKLPIHNIDIDLLSRQPSLSPNISLLKKGDNMAISSDLEICNNLTMNEILLKFPNSTAIDASITQTLCIGMINFFNSGIGGGGYATIFNRHHNDPDTTDVKDKYEHEGITIDFREMAPMKAEKSMFKDKPDWASKIGGVSIAIPGELMGLWELYDQFGSGSIKWSQLLEPIIKLGNQGWEVDEVLAMTLSMYEPIFLAMPEDWSFVLNSTKNGVLKQGDIIKRPNLANTLNILAKNESVAPFYDPNHPLVKSMVGKINQYDGIFQTNDFTNYNVNIEKPLMGKIRKGERHIPENDLTVLTSSGSSSGAALLSALSIMDNFDTVEGGDYQDQTTFQLIETMKWMASARTRLGDFSSSVDSPDIHENIQTILNSKWINNATESICKNSFPSPKTMENFTMYNPLYQLNDPHGTAHFSIIDQNNNAVSLTTTINLLFGSLIHDPITGVIFNNEMDDFSQPNGPSNSFDLTPSIFNFPEPGKRPLSSAAPTIILNELGKPDFVVGASGGSRITTSILQAIIRTYWYKMPLLETIAYPRIHHQLLPDQLEVENITMIGKETVNNLKNMGYTIIESFPKSCINAIKKNTKSLEWFAVSDFWRKRGVSCVN
ncbi:gamma-glutamyltransferase NDAI_0I01800 [Naumovozyma dairenensis CBS 421]|uniref:Glutathione hydrolase n=1 Tax=Naumovozyma dairenensis (strain ATCC 10597 / BCRC 20456 / CBS 421 / NBRC 0211 / NRRL Y-12639) TaxID=1071378 RepID=G0WG38_NAUDC|nr:hypothetical protein NDAI_0I01800 [Naumovozyma dairenensis CBS 421]CCD26749.1 hypothetical protein NDAI_0I01800 [Naumovozyma dairenensis CBS 421]